ncbi:MAG: ASPIC/UnbV domain-containing protein, partial [Planctomycetaceae bacterium]
GLPPTYQAAWADYNNDGSLDLLSGGRLFQNTTKNRGWLQVHLQGDGTRVNRAAVGAQVRIKIGKKIHTRQVEAGTGEGNQNDIRLHFGLGDHKDPVTLDILWPNKARQTVKNVALGRVVSYTYHPSP